MLEPLKQWRCDKCGEIIERPEDGYVEFRELSMDKAVYDDFIIVHHRLASQLKDKEEHGCYVYSLGEPLKNFLGDEGKVRLLSLLDPGPYHMPEFKLTTSNVRKWNDFFMRLQIPYYEEARQYWNRAISDGYFGDLNEVDLYLPKNLKRMIEHYECEDR